MARKAVAILSGDVTGHVLFEQQNESSPTLVTAVIDNLSVGKHGFHIHEFGDTTNGCISAGPHYNPHGVRHGGPNAKERHIGDFGNILSIGEPQTHFQITDDQLTLYGQHSVIGRAVVVHADEDDLGLGHHDDSSTTGHSGPRIACGVIGIAK